MKHDERFVWLDLVRGASALIVCAGHLRAAILCKYGDLTSPGIFQQLFYGVTGLGHQAVMVFFVLSGMFVGGTVLKSGQEFSSLRYAITRLTRLWIVLLPALGMTFVVDSLTLRYAPAVQDGTYYSLWSSGPKPDEGYSTSLGTFLGNAAFVQTILTPVFGTDTPLWSLAYEFWYYVLFPLCAMAAGYLGENPGCLRRLTAGALALIILICLPYGAQQGYCIWLLGVGVRSICNALATKHRYWLLCVSLSLFGVCLLYSKEVRYQELLSIPSDVVVGVGFSFLCVILARWPRPASPIVDRLTQWLAIAAAEPSYSLYTIHFPFVVMIGALVYTPLRLVPDVKGILYYSGWLGILLLIGAVFWLVFERNTNRVRRSLHRLLN